MISIDRTTLTRALRFGCSGILVAAFHAVVALALLRYLTLSPALANGAAFVAATILSYSLNTLWSFSSRLTGRTLRRFLSVSVSGLLLAMGIARVAQMAGLADWQGVVAVLLILPPINFLLHHFWTYR
jgi:putative flippase GtrA